jgi:hypothetical protein
MAKSILAEEEVTPESLIEMITASREIASSLEGLRARVAEMDPALGAVVHTLAGKFYAFAVCAERGLTINAITFHTLARLYNDTAIAIHSIAEAPGAGAATRALSKAASLTYAAADLVDTCARAPASGVRGSMSVN